MDWKTRIQDDMKTAMKAHESLKVGTLRMLIAEVKKKEIDKRAPLDEAETLKTIQSLIKQRQDSVEAFTQGGRQDLADKESAEILVLKHYLPQQMERSEIEAIVVAAIAETQAKVAADMGKVMKAVLPKIAGRADGKLVNEVVRAKLSQ